VPRWPIPDATFSSPVSHTSDRTNGGGWRPPAPSPRAADDSSLVRRAGSARCGISPSCARLASGFVHREGHWGARRLVSFPTCVRDLSIVTSRASARGAIARLSRTASWWPMSTAHSVLHRRAAGPRISSPPIAHGGDAHLASARTAKRVSGRGDIGKPSSWEVSIGKTSLDDGFPIFTLPDVILTHIEVSRRRLIRPAVVDRLYWSY